VNRRLPTAVAAVIVALLIGTGVSAPAFADDDGGDGGGDVAVAQIAGFVLDEETTPVEGVTISAVNLADEGVVASDTTDGTGRYELTGLVAGTYAVSFTPTYVDGWPYDPVEDRTVDVDAEDETVENHYTLTFSPPPPPVDTPSGPTGTASLSGVVRLHGGDDVPLDEVRVWLSYSSDGVPLSRNTQTGADGTYSFAELPPATGTTPVNLEFSKDGYATKRVSVKIADAAVERSTTLQPLPVGTGSISGTVSLPGGGEPGYGSVTLMTETWTTRGIEYLSPDDHDFQFIDLPAGRYRIQVSTEWGAPQERTVEVATTAVTEDIELVPYDTGTATVTGVLRDTRTGDPIPGHLVYLSPDYGQNLMHQSVETDDAGVWSFAGVADGLYTVSASTWWVPAPDGALGWETLHVSQRIEVAGGASVIDQVLELRSFAAGESMLTGRVRDLSTYLPVDGATVIVTHPASGVEVAFVETDAGGTFTAEGLTAGNFVVSVYKDGYTGGTATVIVSGSTSSVVVPLRPITDAPGGFAGGALNITVRDVDGHVVDDAMVDGVLTGLSPDDWASFYDGVDGDGRLAVDGLREGAWLVSVYASRPDGGPRAFAPALVELSADNPTADLVFGESIPSRVTGQVDVNGFTNRDLMIVAVDEDGFVLGATQPEADGTYVLSDLPAADVRVGLQGAESGGSEGTPALLAMPVWATDDGASQTVELAEAQVFPLTGGTSLTGFDFRAVAGGTVRAALALSANGETGPFPSARCFMMRTFHLEGGDWVEYALGWDFGCGTEPLLARGLPAGQYKFEFRDDFTGSEAFRTTYNGGASTLAAAAPVVVTAGEVVDLGTIVASVPEPQDATLDALDLDFLADDPDFDLDAYKGQVSTGDELTAGEPTEVHVGEEYAGKWVNVSLNSTPVVVGAAWHQVALDGIVRVTLPSDMNGSHRLAVGDTEGRLMGWTAVEIAEAVPGDGDDSGDGDGGDSGESGESGESAGTGGSKASGATSGRATGSGVATDAAAEATGDDTTVPAAQAPAPAQESTSTDDDEAEPTAAPDAEVGDGSWIVWTVVGGLVVLVGGAAGLIFVRRRAV
jgi:hypothetical protein